MLLNAFDFLGDALALLLTIGLGAYFWPGSPLRHAAEAWIHRRVSHQFDKELETHRHRLSVDADTVRTEHQRLLQNSALVIERKHEVYRELFRLIHIANGAVGQLYGGRLVPTFEDYSHDDLRTLMTSLRIAGRTSDSIIAKWDSDRSTALRELQEAERRAEISKADEAYGEAWNYFLMNSLYLSDELSNATNHVFEPLKAILDFAYFPEGRRSTEITQSKAHASELLEQLRLQLREQLRIVDSDGRAV